MREGLHGSGRKPCIVPAFVLTPRVQAGRRALAAAAARACGLAGGILLLKPCARVPVQRVNPPLPLQSTSSGGRNKRRGPRPMGLHSRRQDSTSATLQTKWTSSMQDWQLEVRQPATRRPTTSPVPIPLCHPHLVPVVPSPPRSNCAVLAPPLTHRARHRCTCPRRGACPAASSAS